MPKAKFIGYWSKNWQKQYNIPKGYLLLKPKNSYIKDLGLSLNKLAQWQDKKTEAKELDITIEYHYKKRTLNQNALMWALYEIEANEQNAQMSGDKAQNVTPDELYEFDIKTHAPRLTVTIQKNQLETVKRMCKFYDIKDQSSIDMTVTLILGSSQYDVKQMAEQIDRQFNRLAYNGVSFDSAVQLADYWRKWRQELNDKSIVLHTEITDKEQYKALTPICEATNKYIGDVGEVAHIKARGMGGNSGTDKETSANWLHLCREAHQYQHQHGWDEFIEEYPHLRDKVEKALKRGI